MVKRYTYRIGFGVFGIIVSLILSQKALAGPYKINFLWDNETNEYGQFLVEVTNLLEEAIDIEFNVHDPESPNITPIPLDMWLSDINPGEKDNEVLHLENEEQRLIAIGLRNPGSYYICHSPVTDASLRTRNCWFMEYRPPN